MAKRQITLLTGGLMAGAIALAAVALATPGSGVVGPVHARGIFPDPVDIMFKLEGHTKGTSVLHVRDAQETVVQQITFAPGGHTGWHSHPGPALVVVAEGQLTLYSGEDPTCTGRIYLPGQAFIDPGQGHVHIGRASQTQNTILWVTYFDVPPGGAFRIDAADPGNCVF